MTKLEGMPARRPDEDVAKLAKAFMDGTVWLPEYLPPRDIQLCFGLFIPAMADFYKGHHPLVARYATFVGVAEGRNVLPRSINGMPMFTNVEIWRWDQIKEAQAKAGAARTVLQITEATDPRFEQARQALMEAARVVHERKTRHRKLSNRALRKMVYVTWLGGDAADFDEGEREQQQYDTKSLARKISSRPIRDTNPI